MEYTELIRTCESIRNYDPDRPAQEEILKKILNSGKLAVGKKQLAISLTRISSFS
jgi:hypothetical protein